MDELAWDLSFFCLSFANGYCQMNTYVVLGIEMMWMIVDY